MMRKVAKLTAETLCAVDTIIKPGITTEEINTFVHEHTLSLDCTPAPLNYRGFPKSVCTSINEVVCHGIPSHQTLNDGDIVNIDVSHIYGGYYGDTSATFYIGTPTEQTIRLVEVTRRSLEKAINIVKPGIKVGDIGATIQEYVEPKGYSLVREYTGHGIGQSFHEAPTIYHVGKANTGVTITEGMTFTIEPMVNMGTHEVMKRKDGWTVVTKDLKLSAQFEHTILVTNKTPEVITKHCLP